jgi:phospholipid transport system substrate-binding protein
MTALFPAPILALLSRWLAPLALLALFAAGPAAAQAQAAPDEMIRVLSNQILERIRDDKDLQSGDLQKISAFVDESVMPHVNFERMTALAAGRGWRQATPEQQQQLMTEFRSLLLRTYAGALSIVKDQQVRMKPLRAAPGDTEVVVRSEIVQNRGEPIQLDYRLEKSNGNWRIYDLNVLGVWLVESYRNQFTQEISAKGIDGLIKSLADRNRSFAAAKSS